jgi:parallel beta-helix repeat protein
MLYDCDDCTIYRNLIQNSVSYGLVVGGSRNTIHHNAFIDNNPEGISQAYEVDFESDNIWYDILINEGNYWNTWSGTGEYVIESADYITDPYPLSEIPADFPPIVIDEYIRNAFCIFLPALICVIVIIKKERIKEN